ncbi:hypothetical protein BDK88_4318 [Natrinema hispanicum]|uniref:Uncharacterized protein n=1 Tax=Natrinema hispanicum TaxID=392421 RepID=A0A482YAE8_9EURY|nr:hypothetical protein [Natrinema hispanicum]RZV05079.1 hypothetical protein BDK88_4318 [Natrinema hispanicum]
MTTFIPSYLRPLSQVRTGNQSRVDKKAEQVEVIRCPGLQSLAFEQYETVKLWVNEQAYHGKTKVTSDREIRVDKTVDNPGHHWWVISRGLLENIDPPLREHADIFDLLIALNLCTDDPVFFSQNPGQVIGGAYKYERGALNYRGDLSSGNIATALLGMNEIPKEVEITGDVVSVFEQVREYRSKQIATDAEMDIRIALHMYDDALSSDLWTAAANLYYVCENVLFSGKYGDKDQLIAENTATSEEQAKKWRKMVNRVKHPDKGKDVAGILDRDELEIPSLRMMRRTANTVLKQGMAEVGSE